MVGGLVMDVSSAQAAAKKAVEILVELIPEAKYAALEGIELSEDETSWHVVVGYVLGSDLPATALAGLTTSPKSLRTYMTLILDRATLEFKRMEPYHEPA
ncbi:hypothetical protein B5F79_03110 [Olsenella sp. An285]|nr:hypothetical protein B5F79_03110 [Olsenella sp. An285]